MKGRLVAVLVALVVASVAVPAVAAPGNNALDWSAAAAPSVCLEESELVVAEHNTSAMSSPLAYYDDDGDATTLPAHLAAGPNAPNNSVGWVATHVEAPALAEFPRSTDDGVPTNASALDASEWTADAGVSVTDSDGSAATSVESVTVATNGSLGSGDAVTATYDNVSITSDAAKRVLGVWLDGVSIDSGAVVEIAAVDADGDRKAVAVNTSASASATDAGVVATSAVDGVVGQQKLADLPTEANGDGDFQAVEKLTVTVLDGDGTVRFTGLDVDRKSPVVVGERNADTDGDGELETGTVTEVASGGVHYYATVQPSGTAVHDLHVKDVRYCLSDLPSDRVNVTFNPSWTDSYAFGSGLQVRGRLRAPAAIDLSHNGLVLNATPSRVTDRYVTFGHATGTGSTALSEVGSWTDDTSDLTGAGNSVTLLSSPPTGQNVDVRIRRLEREGDLGPLRPPANVGGGGGPVGSGGGIPLAIWGAITGVLGLIAAKVRGAL